MTPHDLLRKLGCVGVVILVLVAGYWIRYAFVLRRYPFYIPQRGGIEFYHTPKKMVYIGVGTPNGWELAKSKEIQEAVRAGTIKCSSYSEKQSEEAAIMSGGGSSGWSMETVEGNEGFRIPGSGHILKSFSVTHGKDAMGRITDSVSHSGTIEQGGIALDYRYNDGQCTFEEARLNGKYVRAGTPAELPFFTVLSRTWKEETKF